MSETLRDLVVTLSLNSDNFTRNIKSVNKQIAEAESQFKLASAGVDGFERTTEGLSAKLSMLERRLSLQKDAANQYGRALEAANNKLTECYNRQNDYARRLEDAKVKQQALKEQVAAAAQQVQAYSRTLGENDSATIAANANLDRLKEEYRDSVQEVRKLNGQNVALKKSTQNAADAVSQANTNLNNAQAAVKNTEAEITRCNQSLRTARSLWTSAGSAMESFGKKSTALGKRMTGTGKALTASLTTPVVALGTAAVKSSIDFESSFAGVRKTVDATEEEFGKLAAASKRMSTQIATSTDEINAVMATGGQLGIANDYLADFTRTMIDLGNSCEDLNADEAAASLAKFANIMGTDQGKFQNLGSTIVDLGNNFATTEKPIMEMSMRLAGAGKQVGLTEAQILGFATALSSVGIEAQMGGSAFSKALIKMEVAAETGGQALEDFASVSDMTSAEFKALWDSDPAAAFQAFIVGLSKMDDEGESAIVTLNDIGISEIRLRDTLLRSTNATELFARAQETATKAWSENTALTNEASKRYATTESKLKNLKNTALLFGQQIGDDLNPTIQNLIDGAGELLDKLNGMDASQRQSIVRFAAFAAAAGPVLLMFGKLNTGIGKVSTTLGTFMASVGKAGGGIKGLASVLAGSPAVWFAVAAAVVAGTAALIDYASGAKQAREALEGMQKTADNWKNTAADTFYGSSDGLSFFGMSEEDFKRSGETLSKNSAQYLEGLLEVWSDGKYETDVIVREWTDSWKALTADTRDGLQTLKATADESGYAGLSAQMQQDLDTLDSLDEEITSLLRKRQGQNFTDEDKVRLQELIDTRDTIAIKYSLTPADADTAGFEAIRQKLEAEVARAQAMGKTDADVSVYENAVVAAAEGMAAINGQLDAQYDKEYAVVQLIEDSAERQAAMDALNARYVEERKAAAAEYAQTLSGVVMPVWQQDDIQQASTDVQTLTQKLREYSIAGEAEKPALLEELNAISASMDESAITEYISLLTQIQSLMDSGMSQSEVQTLFPEIDFTTALDQIASIQSFLNNREASLPGLTAMFGEALPEEVLKIATDLDMTGAQQRWNEFAANPGAITTDAVIAGIAEDETAARQQVMVDAVIEKYTETPEGADRAALTPEGLVAYVGAYAEATNGADVSGLTPENVTAIVTAYQELASGADVSTLTPDEIVAHVSSYMEENGVDMSGLTPQGITATVLAYEEVSGGALTTALSPEGVTAWVARYLEAEDVDISALSDAQIDAIVTRFAEAANCDKSQLLQNFTAYIAQYDDTNAVKPRPSVTVGIYGYDLMAYRRFVADNPVEVQGIVKLGEVYQNPEDALLDSQTQFWQDGQVLPVDAVPTELLTADSVAVLDADGTLHVLITPEVTGSEEAIAAMREEVAEKDVTGTTLLGRAIGLQPTTSLQRIDSAMARLQSYQDTMDLGWWDKMWASLGGASTDRGVLDESMKLDFSPDRVSELSTYVAEVVSAIQQGQEVSQTDLDNLQTILTFLQGLDTADVGTHILEGVGEGMTEAGWDSDAETVAANLEAALNAALEIHSPSRRVKPVGENVAAGVGEGMTEADFSGDAATVAGNVESALRSGLPANVMRSIGLNAMAGLRAGIVAGTSGVVTAMRSAARASVNAAKSALKIHSPSQVFSDEVGRMSMKGISQGYLKESKEQGRVIRNATRYLTGEAKSGAIVTNSNDNRRTYNQNSSVSFAGSSFYIQDKQDAYSLAVEIASLTKRQQRGRGLRMA